MDEDDDDEDDDDEGDDDERLLVVNKRGITPMLIPAGPKVKIALAKKILDLVIVIIVSKLETCTVSMLLSVPPQW